jgi:hypothetical protein
MNIIEKSDEEIAALADPMWLELVKCSNAGNYGDFVKGFSQSLKLALPGTCLKTSTTSG